MIDLKPGFAFLWRMMDEKPGYLNLDAIEEFILTVQNDHKLRRIYGEDCGDEFLAAIRHQRRELS